MTEETAEIKENQEVEVTEAEIIEDDTVNEKKPWVERLTSPDYWLRFVFMVLFGVIASVAVYVVTATVVLQFIWGLVAGEGNDKLKKFGSSISQYLYQILRFLTYNTEDKPFPFSDWPEGEQGDE